MLVNDNLIIYGLNIPYSDAFAMVWFLLCWFGYGWYAKHNYGKSCNLISATAQMRADWMGQMAQREYRIVDAALMGNLMRSITFFANTSIFILFGIISILGYRDEALNVINTLPFAAETSEMMWELKLFLMAIMFAYAFFKYTWSLRLYNYASIFVGATPDYKYFITNQTDVDAYAQRGGRLIANAGRHFNIGLRASYFGLAVLSWFLHAILFVVVMAWVVYEIHRREFRSRAVDDLIQIVELTQQDMQITRAQTNNDTH